MAQLPDDFLTWRSLKSLTATACIAWAIVLVIDVVFISGIKDTYLQLKWVWGTGFAVSFVLASIRLYFKEERERGDRLFLVFNAALIFIYASGFNGFTKELGSWSELQKTFHPSDSVKIQKRSDTTMIQSGWTPSILADQTSYWPDAKMVRENHNLKMQNTELSRANKTLQESNNRLLKFRPADQKALMDENARLREQIKTLQDRIHRFNERQQKWDAAQPDKNVEDRLHEIVDRTARDQGFFEFLFKTPIDGRVE